RRALRREPRHRAPARRPVQRRSAPMPRPAFQSGSRHKSLSCPRAGPKPGAPRRRSLDRLLLGIALFALIGVGQVLGADPASPDAGLHDHVLSFLAGNGEILEGAVIALSLAILTFGPADQIVGSAAGKI